MTRRFLGFATLAAALASTVGAFAAAAPAPGMQSFVDPKFSFAFDYDATWIPSVQQDGESITFALSEGEVFISVARDPNSRHLKTRQEFADDQIGSWKRREGLVFSKLERAETTLGTTPATKIEGTAKEYDEEFPYRLEQYVLERDGKLYVVKYSGLYDPSLPYWDGFQKLVKTFHWRAPGETASAAMPGKTPLRATPRPTNTPARESGGGDVE